MLRSVESLERRLPRICAVKSLIRAMIVRCLAALNSVLEERQMAKDGGPELADVTGLH